LKYPPPFGIFEADISPEGESMIKAYHKLVLAALGAIGVVGCESSGTAPEPEYGCPYADYSLSGTVLDADSSKAIEGIEIAFNSEKTYTAPDGSWQIDCRTICAWRDSLRATDVDGDANRGAFEPDSLALSPTRVNPKDGWYQGSFVQRDILVTMSRSPGKRD
jgi:putative lipoprotein (rSAM/lipoprotein system)